MKDQDPYYLLCPRIRSHPRKHVDVCRSCRWRKKCDAWRRYRQPDLPLAFSAKAVSEPVAEKDPLE